MRRLGAALLILVISVSVLPCEQSAANEAIINKARGSYYSLSRKGFKGFSAGVEPNWEVILAQTATPATLTVFRAVQFSMTLDANGVVTVTHEVGANAAKPELQPTVARIHSDVQRLVTGFFNTWRTFVVISPFPETEFQIEHPGKQYQFFYTTQAGKVSIVTTDDLLITEWNLVGPTVKRTVKPQFQKTADGFLLTGYHQVFDPIGAGIKTTLDFQIEYQDVGGMKLPYKVRLAGIHGSEPVEAELVFRVKS